MRKKIQKQLPLMTAIRIPGASFKLCVAFLMKRRDHFKKHPWLVPNSFTASGCFFPSALSSIILARKISRFDVASFEYDDQALPFHRHSIWLLILVYSCWHTQHTETYLQAYLDDTTLGACWRTIKIGGCWKISIPPRRDEIPRSEAYIEVRCSDEGWG